MRTGHLLTVCCSLLWGRGLLLLLPGGMSALGVCLLWGGCLLRVVSAPGGCLLWGGVCSRGVSAPGGRGVCCEGVSAWGGGGSALGGGGSALGGGGSALGGGGSALGGSALGGLIWGGVCSRWGVSQHALRQTPSPLWTEFLTHACENITLVQLRCGR